MRFGSLLFCWLLFCVVWFLFWLGLIRTWCTCRWFRFGLLQFGFVLLASCGLWFLFRSGRATRGEDQLGFIRCFLTHGRLEVLWALTGVGQLAQLPHDLCKEVPRIGVVVATNVWLALILTPVSRFLAHARDSQPGQIPMSAQDHRASVLGFCNKLDRVFPDAFTPSSSSSIFSSLVVGNCCPNAAGQDECTAQDLHAASWRRSETARLQQAMSRLRDLALVFMVASHKEGF